MTQGGYDAFDDPYSYKGSSCLLHLVALRAGHPLRLDRIKPETFMAAMIQSSTAIWPRFTPSWPLYAASSRGAEWSSPGSR